MADNYDIHTLQELLDHNDVRTSVFGGGRPVRRLVATVVDDLLDLGNRPSLD